MSTADGPDSTEVMGREERASADDTDERGLVNAEAWAEGRGTAKYTNHTKGKAARRQRTQECQPRMDRMARR